MSAHNFAQQLIELTQKVKCENQTQVQHFLRPWIGKPSLSMDDFKSTRVHFSQGAV